MTNPEGDFLDKIGRYVKNTAINVYGNVLGAIDFYKTARAFGESPIDSIHIAIENNPRETAMRKLIFDTEYERNSRPKTRQETIIAPHDTGEKWEILKENLRKYIPKQEGDWIASNLPTFYSLFDLTASGMKNVAHRWKEYKKRDNKEKTAERDHIEAVLSKYRDNWEALKEGDLSSFISKKVPRKTEPNREEGLVETRPDIGEMYAKLEKIRDRPHSDDEIGSCTGRILTDEESEAVGRIREYALTIGHSGLMEEIEKLGDKYTQEDIFEAIKNHALDTRGFERGLGPNGIYILSPEWDTLTPKDRRDLWDNLGPEEQTLHVDLYKKRLHAEGKDLPDDIQMLDGGDLGSDFGVSSFANLYNRLFGNHVDENLWRLEENLEQAILNRNLTLIYGDVDRFKEMTGLEPKNNEEFERLFEEARNFSTIDFMDYFGLDAETPALVRTGDHLHRYAPLIWPRIVEASGGEGKAVRSESLEEFFGNVVGVEIERVAGVIYRYKTTALTNILKAQNLEEARQSNRKGKAETLFELGRLAAADMLDDRAGKFYVDNYYFALDKLSKEDGILENVYGWDVSDESLTEGFNLLSDFNVYMNNLRACRNTRFMKEKGIIQDDAIKTWYQGVFDLGVKLLTHYVEDSSDDVFNSQQASASYRDSLEVCKSMTVTLNGQAPQEARQNLIRLERNRMKRAEKFEDLPI